MRQDQIAGLQVEQFLVGVGFAALLITDVPAVFELGAFSMFGVASATLIVVTGVPSLLVLLPGSASRQVGEGAVHHFVTAALRGEPLTIHNDGSQLRSWCYVDDIVDGLVAGLARRGPPHVTCNLGSGSPVALRTVIETLCAQLGHTPPIVRGAEHPADAKHTHACLERAAEFLGYRPRVPFERGVAGMLRGLTGV